jgi:DMSO/TMAO reductase YedYZ molybdopterin-dependent catalytic subunit
MGQFVLLLLLAFPLFPQSLAVSGDVPNAKSFTMENLRARTQIELKAGEHTYSGVLLMDLLAETGQERGAKLRGTQVAKAVLVECEDDYRVVFSMAELDAEFRDSRTLLALRKNGEDLPANEGPFRLIVEGDKKMARWARRVKSVRVVWLQL